MDAFIQAVDNARRQLIRDEGQNVSVRELIRRAGFDEAQRPGVAYHLNARRHTGEKAHRVPPDLIHRLASVLPISEDELSRAAAVASGLNVVDRDIFSSGEVAYVVSRFFGDSDVSPAERQATTARILQIIAEETAKGGHDDGSDGPSPATT